MASRFANLKVAHKLLLGFGLVFLLMASALTIDVLTSIHQETLTRRLVERLYPAQNTIMHIIGLVPAIDDDGAWYVLENSSQKSTETLKMYYQKIAQLHTLMNKAQQLAQSLSQHQAIERFDAAYFGKHGYYAGNEMAFLLKRTGRTQVAYQVYVSVPFEPSLRFAQEYDRETNQAISQATTEQYSNARVVILLSSFLTLITLLFVILLARLIVRSITSPLKEVQHVMQQLSAGDITALCQGLWALAHGNLTQMISSSSLFPTYQSCDEIGQTAQAMRTIIADVGKATDSYEHARQELQRLYDQLQLQNTALLDANTRLQTLAITDPLTSLGNHRAYQDALHTSIEQAYNRGEVVMLALIDLDEFKILNEEYGHLYGDQLLSSLSTLLREHLPFCPAFRLSGDTFAVLVPTSFQGEFTLLAEQLRLQVLSSLGGATISIGVATSEIGEQQLEMLQEWAYAALHEAKKRGRNLLVNFEMIRGSVKLLSLRKIHALRRLLNEQKMVVAFQPIWLLEQGTVLAFEALARPDLDYGFAGPADAFELAEQLGRGFELDELCIHSTLERVMDLPPDALLFINITPQTFLHDRFDATSLTRLVLLSGSRPDRIVFEITERTSIRLDLLLQAVQQLHEQGFRVALDDAGAGNAGLEMLHQVPVDFVKVDRAVMVNALTQRSSRGVLNGICAIAREANSQVIVEGIEDKAMLDLAYHLKVQAAQGYLLGRPNEQIPAPDVLGQYNPRLVLGKLIAS